MNGIDAVVKSRCRQMTNEPKACFRTVDEWYTVAWVPLKKEAGFGTKYDFMTCQLGMSY
jgi:hypothetical protein